MAPASALASAPAPASAPASGSAGASFDDFDVGHGGNMNLDEYQLKIGSVVYPPTPIKANFGTGVAGTDSSNAYMGGGEEPGGTRHGYMQKYDGTSWASQPSFSTARNSFGYSGTSPLQLICGGQADPGNVATKEEFTAETTALNVKTLTTS